MFAAEFLCKKCGCKTAYIYTSGYGEGPFAKCDACGHVEKCDFSRCTDRGGDQQ